MHRRGAPGLAELVATNGNDETVSPRARRYVARLAALASTTRRPFCFDSTSLIDYFARNEPAASLLDPLLLAPNVSVVVSTISLAELVTRATAQGNLARVATVHAALLRLPAIAVVALDQTHALETAAVRADTGLKLPDAAIVATARLANASALSGNDRQWRNKPLGVPYHLIDDILALP